MKFKFKSQPHQTRAVESVLNCFTGQPFIGDTTYCMNLCRPKKNGEIPEFETCFPNADLHLTDTQLIENIQAVQKSQNLPLSECLLSSPQCKINLDVEMETGTGKTYCYIKTIFEMNRRYGWNKFIIMVPSIAIREGVYRSCEITASHFTEAYGKQARFFVYSSRNLRNLEGFSSESGIHVMIINIQAFNTRGSENRRMYEKLDNLQSHKPIDLISSNRPILILDEPQKMDGTATTDTLPKSNPLMILRYSATPKCTYNRVYRLDAIEAYKQKLVKKIAVRGISMKSLLGTKAFLHLESIQISKNAPPVARMEMEIQQAGRIKRVVKRLKKGDPLYELSGGVPQYKGFTISKIDYTQNSVEFTNGQTLTVGDSTGDVSESTIRRIQIRETIKAHLEKESSLFVQGIKVLSLFFIDEVRKYRDYHREDEKGEYARIFEEEYENVKEETLRNLAPAPNGWQKYLEGIDPASTHAGYFSIDKKTKRYIDPASTGRVDNRGLSNDLDAYNLILKKKERLLSFEEPVRFLFSHSSLREGWDNPNVFVICMLKHSNNIISRRQEVGRGLRLSVNQNGERMDHPLRVHEINVLTVVPSESYKDFVSNLQKELCDSLSASPRKADQNSFIGKIIPSADGRNLKITPSLAKQISHYLVQNGYIDMQYKICNTYHKAKKQGTLAPLPKEILSFSDGIYSLIDSLCNKTPLPLPEDERKKKYSLLNDNFYKKEFQDLWKRLNKRAVYRVEFDSTELVEKCIATLNRDLHIAPLAYTLHAGVQDERIPENSQPTDRELFTLKNKETRILQAAVNSSIRYDLLGELAENVHLTRKTLANILTGLEETVFEQFRKNPEHFITEATRLINEQKTDLVIKNLTYEEIPGTDNSSSFAATQIYQDCTKTNEKLKKHIYDYLITDSKAERNFVRKLDANSDVVVYARFPSDFLIPTPLGDYRPDWIIACTENGLSYTYCIADTKGAMSSTGLCAIEKKKTECARKFFEKINRKIEKNKIQYDVVDSFSTLIDKLGRRSLT